jgi:hypothetical protein
VREYHEYIENPKTKDSGVLCAIPQAGPCPLNCSDCFYNGRRSYLDPLEKNTPNLPDNKQAEGYVVRMNDGWDSNLQRPRVLLAASKYRHVFFNTSLPKTDFPGPVVVTVNPPHHDSEVYWLEDVMNVMAVRFRTDTTLSNAVDRVIAVNYYTRLGVPVILTFSAFYDLKPPSTGYAWKQRTLNSYWCITQQVWNSIVLPFQDNPLVFTCGRDAETHACKMCGNCLRLYFRWRQINANR